MTHEHYTPTTTPFKTGVLGRCPQCQEGHIFDGYLTIKRHCEVCGLDYSYADTADGPAFFAMSIVSPFSVGLALWLALSLDVHIWIIMAITLIFTLLACLLVLRPLKGWMVCSKYVYGVRNTKGY